MKMLTFLPQGDGTEVVAGRNSRRACTTRPCCGAARCSISSRLYSDEMTELLLGEKPVPEALVRKTLRAGHAGQA